MGNTKLLDEVIRTGDKKAIKKILPSEDIKWASIVNRKTKYLEIIVEYSTNTKPRKEGTAKLTYNGEKIIIETHYLDGIYRVYLENENDVERIITAGYITGSYEFLGGIRVPKNADVYFHDVEGNTIIFAKGNVIYLVDLVDQYYYVPFMMNIAWAKNRVDTLFYYKRRYETVRVGSYCVPPEFLPANAPEKYYESFMNLCNECWKIKNKWRII